MIDTGQVAFLKREILQYENLKDEIQQNVDSLVLKLTHDNNADFVKRQRWHNEVKNERARLRYFEKKIEFLKTKLLIYDNNN